jgi:D-glycero-D-manno-heptose 1,7-bisphosphate phosphatase
MIAVIMAGGRGTRIASVRSDIPKPMIPVLGKPILEHQIMTLKKQGIVDFFISIGYLGETIKAYFGDGSAFGVRITYLEETSPLGTAGALYFLKDVVHEDFLLVNGDLIFDVDVSRFLAFHKAKGGMATIMTHPNSHPYDSGLIFADASGLVTKWLHKEDEREWYHNRVNSGIHMLSPSLFSLFPCLQKVDLDREILRPLIERKQLYAYDTPEYIKDMGTPDRLVSVGKDLESGLVEKKNLSHEQKAIFLDRDGTINKEVGFLHDIDDFVLLPGVAEAIRMVNASGFLAIVITNQPVVARGEVTFEELDRIHQKMETLLGREGAYLDGLFFCPHHPDSGFPGERKELKMHCECRKPQPGMLFKARDAFHINLAKSYMVGDRKTDELTAVNGGCVPCRIGTAECEGAISGDSLLDVVKKILEKEHLL